MNPSDLSLYFFTVLACTISNSVAREAIINGDLAVEHEFPYQVALVDHEEDYICGAGIITDFHILTAAHCVLTKDGQIYNRPIYISGGSIDWKKPTVIGKVVKIYKSAHFHLEHESYGDISVLKLESPLGLSHHKYLQHLELPPSDHHEESYYLGHVAQIAGCGWNWIKVDLTDKKVNGGATDSLLRHAEATVVPNSQCQLTHNNVRIMKNHLCARVKQHNPLKPRGVCIGDSGGPLVVDGKTVIAVLSRGSNRCADEEKPGIYTRVTEYLDFIDDAIHDRHSKDIIAKELKD